MATVFRQSGRKVWNAKIRVWSTHKSAWVWKKITTHVCDEQEALSIAVTLEKASGEAKSGLMTRAKAEEMLSSILRLAGVPWGLRSTPLSEFGARYAAASASKAKDPLKAKAPVHWERFKRWAGEKISWPLENWIPDEFSSYYGDLLTEYSERTANDHIATLRQMFNRAEKEGLLKGNPVALVDKEQNNSVEKRTFTRTELAALLRMMRKERRFDWTVLVGLGWSSGARIQDLLGLTRTNVQHLPNIGYAIEFRPGKKEHLKNSRELVLPIPSYLGKRLQRLGSLSSIHSADNRNGKVSEEFISWMERVGIDPQRVQRGRRSVPRKSFHSLRHTLVTRMTRAGVSGELTQLAVDHDDAKMRRRYTHAEIESLSLAFKKARRF